MMCIVSSNEDREKWKKKKTAEITGYLTLAVTLRTSG
jgi:hypothetical protein